MCVGGWVCVWVNVCVWVGGWVDVSVCVRGRVCVGGCVCVGVCVCVGGWVCFLLLKFSMPHYIVILHALELNIHNTVTYIYHLCTISSVFY